MAITLRQDSATGAVTKGASLNFSELDQNFVDLLQNKIQAIQVDADSGSVNVGESLSNGVLTLTGGTNITTSVTEDSAGNANVVINGTDLNTTYNISAETATGGVNLRLTDSGAGTDDVKFAEGTGIQLTRTDANTITITNTVADTDTDTTYTVSAVDSGSDAIIRLTGSDASTDDVTLAAGAGITLTPVGDTITIASTATAPDFAEGVLAGTNIDVTNDSTGQVTVSLESIVDGIELKDYKETVYALSYGATITPNVVNGNVQEITLTGNVAFGGFTSPEDGQSLTLIIHQDGTGSRAFSEGLDSAGRMLFAGGTSTLSTAANATDIMSIVYAGGIYYASLSTNFS